MNDNQMNASSNQKEQANSSFNKRLQNQDNSGRTIVPIRPVPQRVVPSSYQMSSQYNPALIQSESQIGIIGGFEKQISGGKIENLMTPLNTLAQLINNHNIRKDVPCFTLQNIIENLHKKVDNEESEEKSNEVLHPNADVKMTSKVSNLTKEGYSDIKEQQKSQKIAKRKISIESDSLSEDSDQNIKGGSVKKEKNRKAAIECRKKRKEYITSLEESIRKMEHEIYELRTKLNVYEQNEKFRMVSEKESIFSYLAGRDERYNRLQEQVDQYERMKISGENLEEIKKKLDETIDMIQIRHGSNGVIRKQTISYMFKKIIEKFVPSHIRYLTYSCLQENGYFQKIRGRKLAKSNNPIKSRGKFCNFIEKASDPEGYIWKEAINEISLNEEQIRTLKKAKAPVLKLREKISKEMQRILVIKKNIMKLSKELEKTFDKLGAKTYPIQRAKFLLYVDKVKHK